jgi:hypothetical protein
MSVFNIRGAGTSKKKKATMAWRTTNPLAGDLGELFVKALLGLVSKMTGQVARLVIETQLRRVARGAILITFVNPGRIILVNPVRGKVFLPFFVIVTSSRSVGICENSPLSA